MSHGSRRHLIVAPHCDDEVLGCGGLISKVSADGEEVRVVIVTNGHIGAPELFSEQGTALVRGEALDADTWLGALSVDFLDFPAPRLDSIPMYVLANAIQEVIRRHSVTDLYIPHRGDIHKDHEVTHDAALVAARPLEGSPVRRILAYETLSETEWSSPTSGHTFVPTFFLDITDHLERKVEAFSRFNSQLKEFPHPRSLRGIEHLARLRGSTIGVCAAEAYAVVRWIEN